MDDFANYTKRMHEDRDEPFEIEYGVSISIVWNDFNNNLSLILHHDSRSVKNHKSLMQLLILLSTDSATDLPTYFHVCFAKMTHFIATVVYLLSFR